MIWVCSTILIALGMALYVAVRLSRRILTPLNSVANSLREVAEGRLDARVPIDEQAIGETAQLVRDFNTMAERLRASPKISVTLEKTAGMFLVAFGIKLALSR